MLVKLIKSDNTLTKNILNKIWFDLTDYDYINVLLGKVGRKYINENIDVQFNDEYADVL